MNSLCLLSAAKVNLTLDVLGRRPDGYHELSSVVHTIGLYDEIRLEVQPPRSGWEFTCSARTLQGSDNLCVRAARLWQEATGLSVGGHLHLQKNIPVGAGLGGGSGNAAAVLHGLRLLFPHAQPREPWLALCARLGADVPLFWHGGCCLMEGIGDRITPLPKANFALDAQLVVLMPPRGLSTPEVYRAYDDLNPPSRGDTPRFLAALEAGTAPWQFLGNDLAAGAAAAGFDAAAALRRLVAAGALGAGLSGSGAACFGVFAHLAAATTAQTRLQNELAAHPAGPWRVWQVPFISAGVWLADEGAAGPRAALAPAPCAVPVDKLAGKAP